MVICRWYKNKLFLSSKCSVVNINNDYHASYVKKLHYTIHTVAAEGNEEKEVVEEEEEEKKDKGGEGEGKGEGEGEGESGSHHGCLHTALQYNRMTITIYECTHYTNCKYCTYLHKIP